MGKGKRKKKVLEKKPPRKKREWLKSLPLWKYIGLLTILSIIPLFFVLNLQVDFLDDNCHYMNLGKALYTGMGYVQLHLPDHPPENLVAPGLPVILALLMSIRDNTHDLLVFKLFTSTCYLLFLLITAFLFVKYLNLNRWLVLGLILFMVFNIRMTRFASLVATEAPFMMLSSLVILLFVMYKTNGRERFFWLATIASVFAIYIRVQAIPFIVTGFVWLLSIKKWDKAFLYAFINAGVLSLWLLPTWISSGKWGYTPQFGMGDANADSSIIYMLSNLIDHFPIYAFKNIPDILFPTGCTYIFKYPIEFWGIFAGSMFILLMIIGIVSTWRNAKLRLISLYFICYFGMYLFLSSCHERYAVVMSAAIVLMVAFGVWNLLKILRIGYNARKIISSVLLVFMIIALLPMYRIQARYCSETRRNYISSEERASVGRLLYFRYITETQGTRYRDALLWCRDNTPEGAVILSTQSRTGCFVSNRKCICPEFLDENEPSKEVCETKVDSMWEWMLGWNVTHVIVDPIYKYSGRYINPGVRKYVKCMERAYDTQYPRTTVFKIDTTCLRNALKHRITEELELKMREMARLAFEGKAKEFNKLFSTMDTSEANLEAIIGYMDYLRGYNKFEIAETLMATAATLYPDNAKLWLNWGIILNSMRKKTEEYQKRIFDGAVTAFNNALEYGADTSDCMNNLGVANMNMRNYDRALKNFKKAVKHDPKNFRKMRNLLSTLALSGRLTQAKTMTKEQVERDDVDEEYRTEMKRLLQTFETAGKF